MAVSYLWKLARIAWTHLHDCSQDKEADVCKGDQKRNSVETVGNEQIHGIFESIHRALGWCKVEAAMADDVDPVAPVLGPMPFSSTQSFQRRSHVIMCILVRCIAILRRRSLFRLFVKSFVHFAKDLIDRKRTVKVLWCLDISGFVFPTICCTDVAYDEGSSCDLDASNGQPLNCSSNGVHSKPDLGERDESKQVVSFIPVPNALFSNGWFVHESFGDEEKKLFRIDGKRGIPVLCMQDEATHISKKCMNLCPTLDFRIFEILTRAPRRSPLSESNQKNELRTQQTKCRKPKPAIKDLPRLVSSWLQSSKIK